VVAKSLARAGYSIALHYHSSESGAKDSKAEFNSLGVECEIFGADISDDTAVAKMCQAVKARFNRLDVLVTTASIWSPIPFSKLTAEDLRRNFDINTLGTFFAARCAGQIMAEQESGGAIITFGDWAIERPYPGYAPYFVSKGAIPTLTRTLAVELANLNPRIRVNCIHPGPVSRRDVDQIGGPARSRC
jgi:pteridine reductase